MFVKIVNNKVFQFPYSKELLKKDNLNTSFPKNMSTDALASWGVYPVIEGSKPTIDDKTQYLQQADIPILIDGNWVLPYEAVTRSDSEQLAYNNKIKRLNVIQRNEKLQDTDWTQMPDSPLNDETKTKYATYRQKLRNISDHQNWPHLEDYDWPLTP